MSIRPSSRARGLASATVPGRLTAAVAGLGLAATVSLLLAGAAHAQSRTPSATPRPGADVGSVEDQIVLAGTVTVPKGRSVGEVVVFHGRANVAGVVVGDVVVLDGPIAVSGQVSGSVVAMNGTVRLAPTASVGGDVVSAQTVRLVPGALVGGEVREGVAFTTRGTLAALGALLGAVAISVSVLLVLLLLAALAPRGLDRVATAAHTAPFASFGWGLVVAVALPLLAVVASASILGLPLGLSLLLGFGLVAFVGYALSIFTIGRLIVREPRRRAGALFAGWGVATAIALVPFLNVAVWVAGSLFGLGAAIVAMWRARIGSPSRGRHRAGYAPLGTPARPAHAPPSASAATGDDDRLPEEAYPATSDD